MVSAKPDHEKASDKALDGTLPDSWERFEKAVDAAVKSGPKHRKTPETKTKRTRTASVTKKG